MIEFQKKTEHGPTDIKSLKMKRTIGLQDQTWIFSVFSIKENQYLSVWIVSQDLEHTDETLIYEEEYQDESSMIDHVKEIVERHKLKPAE